MNVELLQKVKAAILAKPAKYSQDSWCGTSFCIAGHAIVQSNDLAAIKRLKAIQREKKIQYPGQRASWFGESEIPDIAQKLLGLTYPQRGRLFASDFPDELGSAGFADGKKEHAALGAKRIDLFIASRGRK